MRDRNRGDCGVDEMKDLVAEQGDVGRRRLSPRLNRGGTDGSGGGQSFERRCSSRLRNVSSEKKSQVESDMEVKPVISENHSGVTEMNLEKQNGNDSCFVGPTETSPCAKGSMTSQSSGDERRLSPVVRSRNSPPQKKHRRSNHGQENGNVPQVENKAAGGGSWTWEAVECEKANDDNDSTATPTGKSAAAKVKETLRIFNTLYLRYVQQEEERCKKPASTSKKGKQSESNSENDSNGLESEAKSTTESSKKTSKRPDLKAISEMKKNKTIRYPEKQVGNIPGVDVGYQFFSRAEMVAVGFHSHWLSGIDYIGASKKSEKYKNYTHPFAVAVVVSGQYEDDVDNLEELEYTGQGGNDLLGNKQQIKDQEMVRGNLALKNNMEQGIPVRVIRGHQCSSSYCGKVYTYDGLYEVVEYSWEKGKSEFNVLKYQLRRVKDQPKLTTEQVQFIRGDKARVNSALPGLLCKDICNGQEDLPIPLTNVIDDPPIGINGYTYITSLQVAEGIKMPPNARGCNCEGQCTNPRTCACARLNGSDFPYVSRGGGRLVEAKDVVFECGPNCRCGPDCVNRTSQRGLKYRLEVYRTPNKGWAVRSRDFILAGAPICEYIGVLRRSDELESLDNVSDNEYIFDIDCLHTMKGIEGRERRYKDVPMPALSLIQATDNNDTESSPEFCIDAGSTGNFARFINHSCEPNLFVQCVLSSHHDIRLARVVLFAADNIPPLQELAYDYGYALDSVIGPDGKPKVLPCLCGAPSCRKRLY